MKKYDINSFIIDHVFDHIDKKYKKKKKQKKLMKTDDVNTNEYSVKSETTQTTSDNEYYTITINV